MPKRRTDLPELYTLEELAQVDFLQSTVPGVTRALGEKGIPRKGIVEFYGIESGGKSTVALTFMPEVWIDLEHSLDPHWAAKFSPGVKVSYPETLEQAFGLIDHLLKAQPRVIVMDSLGGGLSERELDSNQQAAQAQATSRWLRLLVNTKKLDNSCLLVVNQLRSSFDMFGPQTTTPGGRLLRHLALMRVEVRRSGMIEVADRKVGQSVLLRVSKNKVGTPWSEGEIHLSYTGAFYDTEEAVKDVNRRHGSARQGAAGGVSGADVAGSEGGDNSRRA